MTDPTERTFIMLKPDAIHRGLMGEVIKRFEQKGFKLVAMKLMWASDELLKQHYADLSTKGFFPGLIKYMSSGPVLPMVWEGKNVVKTGRVMLGETNPVDSKPGTIRGDYGIEVGRNICHGSDGVESAKKEIDLWFNQKEQVTWTPVANPWIYETPVTITGANLSQMKVHINLDMKRDVILHRCQHAWSRMKGAEKKVIGNKFLSILNKLTPQRFSVLSRQAHDLNISTEQQLSSCVNLLFEKAIDEPMFTCIYAQFAKDFLKVVDNDNHGIETFSTLLLLKCKNAFERITADLKKDNTEQVIEAKKDLFTSVTKDKKRFLGIVRLIGELFNNNVLTKETIHVHLRFLFYQEDNELNLEYICQLLTTTGEMIDQQDDIINSCFSRLFEIMARKGLSVRIRFMIMNLRDLRSAAWKQTQDNVPTRI